MKKEYNTPSMIITSFSNEGVIMASGITVVSDTKLDAKSMQSVGFGKWNS